MLKKIGFALSLFTQLATADIYQWTDRTGQVHYGERLPENPTGVKNIKKLDKRLPDIIRMDAQHYKTPPINERYTAQVQQHTNTNLNECTAKKYEEMRHRKYNPRYADEINDWLWKNCQGYDQEMREIERQFM